MIYVTSFCYFCLKLNVSAMERKITRVVGAVIKDGDKFLCMQRCRSKYRYISERWEFPGGKVENDESDHEALLREIKEEMDWDIYVGRQIGRVVYDYPDFSVEIVAYLCKPGDGAFKMFEHLNYCWATLEEMKDIKFTAADRQLIDEFLSE